MTLWPRIPEIRHHNRTSVFWQFAFENKSKPLEIELVETKLFVFYISLYKDFTTTTSCALPAELLP